VIQSLRSFLRLEAASGIVLVIAAAAAMLLANSPLSSWYESLLATPMQVRAGTLGIAKPLLLWINDGLMAIFFLLVGLEIKREALEGELSEPSQIALPALAALGGMAVPAAIYASLNWADAAALRGWAIPTATDIAFALGVLALLGSRVPAGLKIFLLTLAILDDLGAIVIIALIYTTSLSASALGVAAAAIAVLAILNWRCVTAMSAYVITGVVLWIAVLESGVHATLAGVVLALFIPLRTGTAEAPAKKLEEDLHPAVAFVILPVFAFANSGISLSGIALADLAQPVPAGIALGLFAGKQIGVFGMSWLAIRTGLARMPAGASWLSLYGVAVLCGIGFTMSLFIASLAFEHGRSAIGVSDRLGIMSGSVVSAIAGYCILRAVLPSHKKKKAHPFG
jgi:NhaA family Na+:H+ antiporter